MATQSVSWDSDNIFCMLSLYVHIFCMLSLDDELTSLPMFLWKRAWSFAFLNLQPYLQYEFNLVHNRKCDMLILDEADPTKILSRTGPHGNHNFVYETPSFEAEFYFCRGDPNKGTKNIKFDRACWLSRMLGRDAYLGYAKELDGWDCRTCICMMILHN